MPVLVMFAEVNVCSAVFDDGARFSACLKGSSRLTTKTMPWPRCHATRARPNERKSFMKTNRKVRANLSPEKSANQPSAQGDIVSAYIADQPRDMLDRITATFLNHASARAVFLEFFQSLSRPDYNRLVRGLYAVQPDAVPDSHPESAVDWEKEIADLSLLPGERRIRTAQRLFWVATRLAKTTEFGPCPCTMCPAHSAITTLDSCHVDPASEGN